MREVASGVWQISFGPRDAVNVYLVGDVLIDAGTSSMGRRLVRRLAGRRVTAHAITHAHPDHVGGSSAVCEDLGIELWAPAGDAPDVERGRPTVAPGTWASSLVARAPGWKSPKVARRLVESDSVGAFQVLDTPGHSPGHVSFWRESDRVLVVGDVFLNRTLFTGRVGVREPPRVLTVDPERNRNSMKRLAELDPAVALFGHGPPMFDADRHLGTFVDGLERLP
ncbi:MAG: MBL fold metallo-hydrolase [Solirubrobacterales bacterium]|nr:MBL fold metallo-hydrolase [Solirubrobacterales bacterium]MBV9799801.1 MBL fold metallo-hydrolase [Solirubrobacterales bacterium]